MASYLVQNTCMLWFIPDLPASLASKHCMHFVLNNPIYSYSKKHLHISLYTAPQPAHLPQSSPTSLCLPLLILLYGPNPHPRQPHYAKGLCRCSGCPHCPGKASHHFRESPIIEPEDAGSHIPKALSKALSKELDFQTNPNPYQTVGPQCDSFAVCNMQSPCTGA